MPLPRTQLSTGYSGLNARWQPPEPAWIQCRRREQGAFRAQLNKSIRSSPAARESANELTNQRNNLAVDIALLAWIRSQAHRRHHGYPHRRQCTGLRRQVPPVQLAGGRRCTCATRRGGKVFKNFCPGQLARSADSPGRFRGAVNNTMVNFWAALEPLVP